MNGMNKVTATNSSLNSGLSSAALRRLFGWIESRYGGNIPIESNAQVITVPVPDHHHDDIITMNTSHDHDRILRTEDLVRLMTHEPGVIAIHVKEFYHRETAIQIGKELLQEAASGTAALNWKINTNRGLESSDVTTIGAYQPYNVVVTSTSTSTPIQQQIQAQEEQYFEGVQKEHYQRRRKSLSQEPFLWPLDLLRLQLDEAWPAGAGLARRDSGTTGTAQDHHHPRQSPNPPFGGGLPRIMYGPTRYTKGFVHVDEMGPLHPQNGLFSANIYLHLPDRSDRADDHHHDDDNNVNEGSQYHTNHKDPQVPQEVLEIWPTRIMNRWDWYRNMLLLSCLSSTNIEDQIRLRHELGCEPVRVAVSPGDLVLFCVQRPHAAIGFQYGSRVSLQCFIQHMGMNQRLLIDS